METGDVFQHKMLGDKAVFIANIPVARKVMGHSPNLHEDDPIDLSDGNWVATGKKIYEFFDNQE